ncbi:putative retrotransposon gag domain-containing protein [Medicago truncatula]|uniref:Putative retrotransposon gag domain-containing protein n=1 Tax=Medicago truncatula TaxID=3880 RepID=A0A396I879_MEDTR|nr:putative retrotransposon gag domain-containing protein [Medicago truncatula]
MTWTHRQSSSESASYYPATAQKPKHHNRIPKQKLSEEYKDEDNDNNSTDADDVDSESQEDQHRQFEDETEEEEEDNDDDDDDVSESLSNAPHGKPSFSQEAHIGNVPESPSVSSYNVRNPTQPMNASSYIQIAPLPIFRGTPNESPITHLSRFNKVCRANNASSVEMQKKIFPVTLEEESALWYDLNIEPYYISLSWDEIKLSFLQAYYEIEPVEELRSELMGIHQGEKERVRSYFLRLQWILKRWPEHGLEDDVIKGVFVNGLREEFHDWVLMQKPTSLNDALRLTFDFEYVRRISGKKEIVSTCGFCEGPHEESSCGVREETRELWRQSGKKEGSDKVAKDLFR